LAISTLAHFHGSHVGAISCQITTPASKYSDHASATDVPNSRDETRPIARRFPESSSVQADALVAVASNDSGGASEIRLAGPPGP
jgi:hypothetical protein